MTEKQMISTLKGLTFGTVVGSKGVEALEMAIQALSQEPICDRDCEHCTWTECPIEPCDDVVSIRKDILKCRVGNIVAYNVEWLKKHWQMEMDIVCGVEPCDDAISRDAVLSLFDKSTFASWDLTLLEHKIKDLPSVTQKSGWIPVSERLPEQDKTGCSNWHSVKVFAQIKSNINDVWETEIVKGYFIEFDNEMAFSLNEFPLCIPDGWDFITLDKDNRAYDEEYSERYVELQAWMPLPKPYEPQESEK